MEIKSTRSNGIMDRRTEDEIDEILSKFLEKLANWDQTAAAKLLGIDRRRFNDYYNHRRRAPDRWLVKMERLLHARGIYLKKTQSPDCDDPIARLSHSERAKLVIADAEWGKKRRGRRSKKDSEIIRHNYDELKNSLRTDEKLAKKYHFTSRFVLREAVKTVKKACPEVIKAMDEEIIFTYQAAQLSTLPVSEQLKLLAQGKKAITAYFAKEKGSQQALKKITTFEGLKKIETHQHLRELEIRYQLPLRKTVMGLSAQCNRQGKFLWDVVQLQRCLLLEEVPLEPSLAVLCQHHIIEKQQTGKKCVGQILL